MELYKTLRNLAFVSVLTAIPYVCNDGCASSFYKQAKAQDLEIRQQYEKPTLETHLQSIDKK